MNFNAEFFFNAFSIVLIDVLLGGDNAIVIALAVRSLPPQQRKIGIAAGAGAAVVLRIVLTFFAAQLLGLNYIKFVGGVLILWIAVKLLTEGSEEEGDIKPAASLAQAVWLIFVADVTMSIDNILAVAAASKGHLGLLIFGLVLSISFVVFASNLLSRLMAKYPIVMYIGAGILGRVGGDMMITDPWIQGLLHPSHALEIGIEIFFTVAVVLVGWLLARRGRLKRASDPSRAK